MKKLILLGLLLASTVQAEYLPAGCYVADYYRTDQCWGEDVGYFNWLNYDSSNPSGENFYYGKAVSVLIEQETLYRTSYESVANLLNKERKLTKKLKRACGSACKRIK